MSLALNLGVLDVAYSDANGSGETSTGDVAEILEKNYHVMQKFFESRQDKIAQWLADDMANSIEMLANGSGPISTASRKSSAQHVLAGVKRTAGGVQSGSLTYGADQKIEAEFRAFIFSGEMQTAMSAAGGGRLSAAADAGVNHRKKKAYAKSNKARPAFVDTGLYVSAFRAWTEDK